MHQFAFRYRPLFPSLTNNNISLLMCFIVYDQSIKKRKHTSQAHLTSTGAEYSSSDEISLGDNMADTASMADRLSLGEDDSSSDDDNAFEFMREFLSKQGELSILVIAFFFLVYDCANSNFKFD